MRVAFMHTRNSYRAPRTLYNDFPLGAFSSARYTVERTFGLAKRKTTIGRKGARAFPVSRERSILAVRIVRIENESLALNEMFTERVDQADFSPRAQSNQQADRVIGIPARRLWTTLIPSAGG